MQGPELRVWKVRFVGEGSVDAGGPYRESLSDAVKELHMPHLGLFVPCSNQQAGNSGHVDSSVTIHNMDKFVPNPTATRPLHQRMFGFVGKLMGIAMRTQAALPFLFPPLFWKRLCGHPVGRADLKGIDLYLVDYLDVVEKEISRSASSSSSSSSSLSAYSASFDERFGDRTFTTKSVTGVEVELGPMGKKRHLSLANAREFVQRVYGYHLAEFDVQVAQVAAGLATVVPLAPLRLFTPSQLQTLVCGKSEVDLELLKSKTTYEGDYSATHPTIVLFWQMMENFTHDERSAFLKFVWSRDRLPLRPEDFRSNFKISRARVRKIRQEPKRGGVFLLPVSSLLSLLSSELLLLAVFGGFITVMWNSIRSDCVFVSHILHLFLSIRLSITFTITGRERGVSQQPYVLLHGGLALVHGPRGHDGEGQVRHHQLHVHRHRRRRQRGRRRRAP